MSQLGLNMNCGLNINRGSSAKFCVCAVILLASLNAAALEEGCIQGVVLDRTGAPVPSTYVTGVSLDRTTTHEVTTEGDGSFYLGYVDAGDTYDVIASDLKG